MRITHFILLSSAVFACASPATGSPLTNAKFQAVPLYGALPLRFEANNGQTDPQVKFLSRARGHTLFLTASEAVVALQGRSREVLRLRFAGANQAPRLAGLDESGRSHYFIGNDRRKWHPDVPVFNKVRYEAIYPGVDLIFYGNQSWLEFDFVVRPNANPGAIRLAIAGARRIETDRAGDLVLRTANNELRLRRPLVYQERDGVRQEIAAAYERRGRRVVGFRLGSYDPGRSLIIDPVLSYSTYLGGSGSEWIYDITVDSAGNAYLAGATSSVNFPRTSGAFQTSRGGSEDGFVAKLNAGGSALVYATYLGGNDADSARSIAIDSAGNAYVTGTAGSGNFPTSAGALQTTFGGGQDAYVAKLNPNGSALVYSTFLGGSSGDNGEGITVDSSGSAYVIGSTLSSNFRTTTGSLQPAFGGFVDAFVAKLNASGSALVYSSFLGGTGLDSGQGIAVDSAGNAYVSGNTSGNFPTTPGSFQPAYGGNSDGFVAKLNPSGSAFVYSTYLGGSLTDGAAGIAVDASGSAYVTGSTTSVNFPLANAFQPAFGGTQDAFVTKLNPAGSALVYSTYLGGSRDMPPVVTGDGTDRGGAIAVDASGNAHVTGRTSSNNFPLASPLAAPVAGGACSGLPCFDAFVAKLNSAGTGLIYSTFLGGNGTEEGATIAVDSAGNTYVAGFGTLTNFPVTAGSFQTAPGGGFTQSFVAKIADVAATPAINPGGAVNGASFAAGAAVAAGSIVSVFGSNFSATQALAGAVPLPTLLANSSAQMDGRAIPLFFVSPTQLNIQVPWELAGQAQASLVVTAGSATSSGVSVNLAGSAPGIFTTNQSGSGQGAVLIASSGELAAPVGSIPGRASRPARRGEFLSIYCTGLGAVSNRPASGASAAGDPLSMTVLSPGVTVAGIPARVTFSGLAPGFVGLYQINVEVPGDAPAGDAVPLIIVASGTSSNTVTIAIQ